MSVTTLAEMTTGNTFIGVLRTCSYQNKLYCDGGIRGSFPLEHLLEKYLAYPFERNDVRICRKYRDCQIPF